MVGFREFALRPPGRAQRLKLLFSVETLTDAFKALSSNTRLPLLADASLKRQEKYISGPEEVNRQFPFL